MKKTSVFNESKMDGKLNVSVTVFRTYGKEQENANADGDVIEIERFRDDYRISVKLEGAINADVYSGSIRIDANGNKVIDLGRLTVNGKKRNVALTLECMDAVCEACRERNEEVSPEDAAEIEKIKIAIANGNIMPAAELNAKRTEYRLGMLEGGEGYNPYDHYVTAERVELVKSTYPNLF